MRLLVMGCQYAGKTTLAVALSNWMIQAMGLPFVRWHNHFVVPKLDQHLIVESESRGPITLPGKQDEDMNTEADEEQIMALRPSVLEQLQRHNIWRHLHPDMFTTEDDNLMIDAYYADSVYAPLYYGYGAPGTFGDRTKRARAWDYQLLKLAPDTALVLVKAAPDVIRERMRRDPKRRGILREQDVETVLERFQAEYDSSLVSRRFSLDTSDLPVERSLQEFLGWYRGHMSDRDLLRMVAHSGGESR